MLVQMAAKVLARGSAWRGKPQSRASTGSSGAANSQAWRVLIRSAQRVQTQTWPAEGTWRVLSPCSTLIPLPLPSHQLKPRAGGLGRPHAGARTACTATTGQQHPETNRAGHWGGSALPLHALGQAWGVPLDASPQASALSPVLQPFPTLLVPLSPRWGSQGAWEAGAARAGSPARAVVKRPNAAVSLYTAPWNPCSSSRRM